MKYLMESKQSKQRETGLVGDTICANLDKFTFALDFDADAVKVEECMCVYIYILFLWCSSKCE